MEGRGGGVAQGVADPKKLPNVNYHPMGEKSPYLVALVNPELT
jgi:hypothetical protein